LRAALRLAEQQLQEAGVPAARSDAEELAAHLLDVARGQLVHHLDAPSPDGFADLVASRARRVPLQHLTGCAHFRRVRLAVGPGVFVPRPETEVVVEAALARLREVASGGRPPVVVDLGSGSGAIAVALADEAPWAQVHAVEIDPSAWPWLRRNVAETTVHLHECDMVDVWPGAVQVADVVISNPPYIPIGAVPRDAEVAVHDPAVALYSGRDGLHHARRVEQVGRRVLRPGGWVVVEHGDLQGQAVPGLFRESTGWTDITDHRDLTDRPRFTQARRVPEE